MNHLGGCCANCGYSKNLAVLSFHHKNPEEKKFGLDARNLWGKSKSELIEEANKCLLLCSNCHLEIHYTQYENWQNIDKSLTYSNFSK